MRSPASMERPGIIYLAVNRVNHKAYVGKTTKRIEQRFAVHEQKARLGYKSHFYSAIRKYGLSVFDIAVLEQCNNDFDLNLAEIRWIATLGSKAPVGYNTTDGGEGCNGAPKTEAWKASVTSPQYRALHSVRAKRWRAAMSAEERVAHQAKITAKVKGRSAPRMRGENNPAKSPEVRNKIRISKLGKSRPAELASRIAEKIRLKWLDPGYRLRVMANRKSQSGIPKKKNREIVQYESPLGS